MIKNNFRLKEALIGKPWLMTSSGISAMIASCNEISTMAMEEESYINDFYSPRESMFIDENGIAHISITNALLDEAPKIYEKLGLATTYKTLTEEIKKISTSGAKGVLFYADSCGGMVSGCIEVAKMIMSLSIPSAGYIKGNGCSACYMLLSGVDAIFASESAYVGNIGSVLTLENDSGFYEMHGITTDVFSNEGADLKTTGYLASLTSSQRSFLQDSINKSGESFKSHVLSSRELDEEVFRAGWYSGEQAVELGLVDKIGSMEDAKSYLMQEINALSVE